MKYEYELREAANAAAIFISLIVCLIILGTCIASFE
jgi:uncharacterized protein (DUF983 family)